MSVFLLRYTVSSWLMRLALWIMPDSRYRKELLLALYDLKAKVFWDVIGQWVDRPDAKAQAPE